MDKPSGTVEIHGRLYETVALRVRKFREAHPDWTLKTSIIDRGVDVVTMLAEITDETGRLRATGHAEEYRKASQINRTSALENCETSAIGRALACLGLGGTEFASADEVANALSQQKSKITPTEGALERVLPDRMAYVNKIASSVIDCLAADLSEEAAKVFDNAELDTDEKVAVWSLFDRQQKLALRKTAIAKKAGMDKGIV